MNNLPRCTCSLPDGHSARNGVHLRPMGIASCRVRCGDLEPGQAKGCPGGCGKWEIDANGELIHEPNPGNCRYRGRMEAYAWCPRYWHAAGCKVVEASKRDNPLQVLGGEIVRQHREIQEQDRSRAVLEGA